MTAGPGQPRLCPLIIRRKNHLRPSNTHRGFFLLPVFAGAGTDTTHFSDLPVDAEPCEDSEGEALDIEATFKRKLMGLRRMPR